MMSHAPAGGIAAPHQETMMTSESELTIDGLASRIARVERENRQLRVVAILAVALGAASFLFAQGVFDKTRTISAGTLLLRNASGDVIALLGSGTNGRPFLGLNNAKGDIVATLGVGADDRPALALADEQKQVRATVGLTAAGAPWMMLSDGPDKPRVTVTTSGLMR
jgi:hypothetical protein